MFARCLCVLKNCICLFLRQIFRRNIFPCRFQSTSWTNLHWLYLDRHKSTRSTHLPFTGKTNWWCSSQKTAYRVKKKILPRFGLMREAVLKLSKTEQRFFAKRHHQFVFPVKGKWGTFGWTYVDLNKVNEDLFQGSWLNRHGKMLRLKIWRRNKQMQFFKTHRHLANIENNPTYVFYVAMCFNFIGLAFFRFPKCFLFLSQYH